MSMSRVKRGRKGVALLLAIIALGLLVSIGLSMSYVSMSEVQKSTNYRHNAQAVLNAQSGLDYMIYTLQNTEPLRANTQLQQMANIADAITNRATCSVTYDEWGLYVSSFDQTAGGSFECALLKDPVEEKKYTLYAKGEFQGAPHMVSVDCYIQAATLFDCGGFGDAGVELDSGAVTDSYNSSLGTYASQAVNTHDGFTFANTDGSLGSNQDILVGAGAVVFGSATPGPAGTITNNGYVSGSTDNANETMEMETIEIPTPDWYHGSLNHEGDLAIGPGVHHYDSFYVEGGEITITGPAAIIADSFEIDADVQITIDDANGPVDIYGTGYFNLDRETDLGNPDAPHNLRIWITTDTDDHAVIIDAEANTWGTIYAPNADLNLDASGAIFGSVIGRSIYMDRGFRLHYDEDLLNHGKNILFVFDQSGYTEYQNKYSMFNVFGGYDEG